MDNSHTAQALDDIDAEKVDAALKLKPGEERDEALSRLSVLEKELALETLIIDGLLAAMSKDPKASLIKESRRFIEEARNRRQRSGLGSPGNAPDDTTGAEGFPEFEDSSNRVLVNNDQPQDLPAEGFPSFNDD